MTANSAASLPDRPDQELNRLALRSAWDAWIAGSFPVGAVLARGEQVVKRGHNKIFRRRSRHGEILQHAEIDALSGLSPDASYEDLTLITTLEPCLMCLGAVVNVRIGAVRFLSADPYGGAAQLAPINLQMQRYELDIDGPVEGRSASVASGLVVSYLLATGTWPGVLEVFSSEFPSVMEPAHHAVSSGLATLAESGAPFEEAESFFV